MRQAAGLLLPFIIGALLIAGDAAAVSFGFASRTDEELAGHAGSLMDGLDRVPQQDDRDGVFLECAEWLKLSFKSVLSTNNRLLYVLDEDDDEILTQTEHFPSGMTITSAVAFVLKKNGEVIHLDERDVRTPPEDGDDWTPHVVIGFPSVDAGDILGWSVVLERGWPRYEAFRLVRRDAWVARSRFILQLDENLGYSARVHNMPRDNAKVSSSRVKNGHPTLIDVTMSDIRREKSGVFSPPPLLIDPYVEIALSAYYNRVWGIWVRWDNWNYIALRQDRRLEEQLKANDQIKDLVKSIVSGLESEQEKADALYRYVRDEIPHRGSWENRGGEMSARKVLEEGVASAFDKTVLLTSMLRNIGVKARIVYARDRSLGEFDHKVAGFWQVTDSVVLFRSQHTDELVWYAPGANACAPRTLPPHLRGAEVVVFEEDLVESAGRKWRTAIAKSNRSYGEIVARYRREVAAANWHRFLRTEGDPLEISARCQESRVLDLDTGEDSVELSTEGLDHWAERLRGDEDEATVVDDYCDYRGFTAERDDTVTLESSADGHSMMLEWSGKPDLPPKMGDTWILPPELTFGESIVSFWHGPDRGPIYVGYSSVREVQTEIRLPKGASVSGFDSALSMTNPFFDYEATIEQSGQSLLIHRRLEFKPGLLQESAMDVLDDDVRRIQGFSAQSLVVTLDESSR